MYPKPKRARLLEQRLRALGFHQRASGAHAQGASNADKAAARNKVCARRAGHTRDRRGGRGRDARNRSVPPQSRSE